ncbi:hypothetical protein KFL_000060320 [Klebsormidium nitens]|uniref:Uncharacterized protein n=1 Tax=Klebsormidium nitens TaxID=105231 RepID=A0A0U9HPW9_KLENI|nr:hypothetical protein KFL_000060320 [Klebsormidium nitens]|eukprot:GAQ77967.1 hypothetical protein KFL_000060320 [Klebsormidium nitens]
MVELPSMTKTDTVTGRTSEIRIACPLDAAGIAAAIAKAEHAQKKLVLHDLVESLRAPEHIEDLVKGDGGNGLELVGQRPNPYLDRESDQYQRFLDTLAQHMHDLKEMLVNESGQKRRRAEPPIEHVFHGTRPENLDSIVRDGMDPRLRRAKRDYFATKPAYSLDFTNPYLGSYFARHFPGPDGPQKLLVFLVLTLPVGFLRKEGNDAVVVMDKVEYELPIFEVTVRYK